MPVSTLLYLLAAFLSVLGAVAHELLGAPKVLAPLETSDLPKDVIWLHHFSWHVGTVATLIMAALFVAATRTASGRTFAAFATAMSVGFALLGIGLAMFGDPVVWTTPAPYPWTIVAALGGIGLATHRKAVISE